MSLPILEIAGLSKSYGAVVAVDDVSLHVRRSEILGLIGPNGSVKSTFFDCTTGLNRPNAGRVSLDGQDITGWSLSRIAREGRMLRSFQKTVVFKALDVEENLVIAGQMFSFPDIVSTFGIGKRSRDRIEALRVRARELIRMAGLWDVKHMPAGTRSGGQQKLIQFASMLMPEPKIILLDEPMAGINPKIIERVIDTIRYANKELGVSFVVIEHNIDVVTSLCERVVVLDQGRKLAEGTAPEIIANRPSGRPTSVDKSTLAIRDLRAGYGQLEILNGVDLAIPPGQFVALMGPNGAGKSTLLKTLYGMTTVKGGSIDWQGENIAGMKSRAVLSRGNSFVPQGRCNFPVMTVDENLQMAAYTLRDEKVAPEREYVYDLFPILKKRRATLAGNMSGGEQQLLEVAMAVLQRPKVLLVDEPSVGLSPAAIHVVFDEILRLHASGLTILLVEQNTKKAMEVAERAVILRLGKVIWDGKPAEITHDELGELFLTGKMRDESEAVH